jgi:hypothetical protein
MCFIFGENTARKFMEPIELLTVELQKYKSALNHLEISIEKKEISKDLYNTRKENVTRLIDSYRHVIETLKVFG